MTMVIYAFVPLLDNHVKTDLSESTTAVTGDSEHDDTASGEIFTPTDSAETGELSAQDDPESLQASSSANISSDESEQNESEVLEAIESNVDIVSDDHPEETVVGATICRDIEDGLYILIPKLNSARCVSIAGNSKSAGANVQLVARNGGFAQAFYVRRIDGTSRYTLVNYHRASRWRWIL